MSHLASEASRVERARHVYGSEAGLPGPIPFGAPGLGDIPLNRPAALR